MPFVADDLGAWLVALLADAGRKTLTTLVLGNEQERALRQAATAAVGLVARELRPEGSEQAEELAMVISQVFSEPVPDAPLMVRATLLEALQAGIAGQLAVLDDASLTGTGQSSAQVLGLSATTLTERLTGQLMREIVARGSRGGPLEPLAAQLNHDVTHLQGQRLEGMVSELADEVREALARCATGQLPPLSSSGDPVVILNNVQTESISLAVGTGVADPDERLQRLLDASDVRTRRRLRLLGLGDAHLEDVVSWTRARPLPPEVASLAPGHLLVLVGDLGAGKTEIAEMWHREAIIAAADGQSPFPVWLNASAVAGRMLDDLAAAQVGSQAVVASRGCDIVIDELDALSNAHAVNSMLDEAANFASTRGNVRVIATIRPGYRGIIPSERYDVPLLEPDDALALVAAAAGEDRWISRRLPDAMREGIRTPLYALLTGFELSDPPVPYCRASLLQRLAERIIDAAARCTGVPVDREAVSAALRRIAVSAVTGGSERVLDMPLSTALLVSRLVAEDYRGRLRFGLPVVEQYFAAQALARHEADIADIVSDLATVTRWRYSMAMMLATSSPSEADELMNPLVRAHPGVGGWLVEEAIAISGGRRAANDARASADAPRTLSPSPPADPDILAAGVALRAATAAWTEGLGRLGGELAPTGSGGRLRPLGVGADRPDSLETVWAPDGAGFPDVFLLASPRTPGGPEVPPLPLADPGWGPVRVGVLPDSANWAWRWSHEQLRQALQQVFSERRLSVPAGGMLAAERDWHLARILLNKRGMGHEPLDPAAVCTAVAAVRQRLEAAPERPYVRFNQASRFFRRGDLDGLAIRCGELAGSGQMLRRPAPEPDRRLSAGGWIWNLYSPGRLLELVQIVWFEALTGYAQLVDEHFPQFKHTLGLAALGRPAIHGYLITNDAPGFAAAPSLSYLLTAADPDADLDTQTVQPILQDPPAALVDIAMAEPGQAHQELAELARKLGAHRVPRGILAASYGIPRSSWTTLDVYGDAPATLLAYRWLNEDLAALNWMKLERYSD